MLLYKIVAIYGEIRPFRCYNGVVPWKTFRSQTIFINVNLKVYIKGSTELTNRINSNKKRKAQSYK
jgi:hypothetical protein